MALGASGVATFRIFSSELMTGGGAFEYPGGDNQTLSFADRSNPISNRSIRYFWNGQPANPGGTGSFAGFTLIDTPSESTYASTPGRNLGKFGYTKITFYARGSLSTRTNLKIEGADDAGRGIPVTCMTLSTDASGDECGANGDEAGAKEELTSGWQKYTLPIYMPTTSLTDVKDFFKATFVYDFPLGGLPGEAPGQGGTVYLDQIQYEP